ncbi:Chromodomain Y-like protein 2 [Araneus ventricosus]|uniref:Chromodomain Y-like protein 2 n=1 Tax=Araneus ventricosus TaxID=182803 RepID=A0A4Y2H869_ARAVE|nr:Chromodomain Y-like protein 2 [Araneus ventricosus]
MDKRAQDLTKMHGSTSLPLGHEILAEQPQWTRCNSFSSCSNDSSVFCSGRPSQNSIFQADKHLISDGQHSSHLSKRNRNSSGSSVSSTVSSASDRDTKNTSVIITSTSLPQVVKTEIRSESLSRLSCPEINPNSFNLQHEALLSCSGSPNSVLPFRHNLRRNIRKKTCSCDCTTTCTTLVVRRYKEKNLEEETVISSTKVQTCVQNNATQAIHNVSFEKSFSSEKTENNRKRRSEVEKLYDSLHEIKWAKNFSPDNILRQLNIRQAASCSLFGRPSPNKSSSTFSKPSKKQKLDSDQSSSPSNDQSTDLSNVHSTSPSNDQSTDLSNVHSTTPKTSSEKKKSNRIIKNHVRTNLTLRSHSKIAASKNVDSSPVSTDASKQSPSKGLKTSDVLESEEKVKSSSPVKSEHNSIKNCVGSLESSSIKHENCVEKSENEESSLFTKAESSSLPINYLLNLKGNSDIEIDCPNIVSEYPSAFYDIAEEGIRTIDACFREVGAEVVVSTCYEKDNDLPRLTAVRDNVLDKCSPIDDGPPVLEPCVSLQDRVSLQNIECKVASDFPVSDKSDAALKYLYEKNIHRSPKREKIIFTRNSLQDSPVIDEDQNQEQSINVLKKLRTNSVSRHVDNSLVKDACKKISNKYLKLLRSKSRVLSVEKPSKLTKIEESSSILPINRTIDPTVIENKPLCQDNSIASHSSAISRFPFDSKELSFRTAGENAQTTTILQTSNKRVSYSNSNFPERIAFNQSTSNSFMYSNDKESFSHVSTSTKNLANQSVIVEESSTNFLHVQHTPLPPVISTTYVPIKNAIKEKKTLKAEVPRPPAASFTCHYQTIKVNRQNSYTQVQLKLNRGCSIFLTVETLTEMKDVLHRTSQDANCHILILNGIGDSFCLGLDLLPLLGPQKIKASTEIAVAVKEFIEELSSFKKPFVAVANGSAFGLGMTILNHADICIASDTAKFCLPQTSLGYFPEGGATLTLPQAVGSTMAMDLILRGRTITAHEAKSIGLVSEVMEAKYLPYDLVTRVKLLAENSQTRFTISIGIMTGATSKNTLLNECCNATPFVGGIEEISALILVDDLRNAAYL